MRLAREDGGATGAARPAADGAIVPPMSSSGCERQMQIVRADHLVLTVANVERSRDWYSRVLSFEPITFAAGRRALAFGRQKINLHQQGSELKPHARVPTPGSADLCFISALPLAEVQKHLATCAVEIELGPVGRSGASGPITSLYVRDPDGNLIEISTYDR
jgi:catechol 2,3-dioxygenase-like lactoylglutathione lyase family enzyme